MFFLPGMLNEEFDKPAAEERFKTSRCFSISRHFVATESGFFVKLQPAI